MPDYLYHYTNLETLRLILKNKTFRLSSLNKMDDLEEGDTQDFQKLGRFTYISSWTNNPDESLLLWGYSKGNNGVRIRMKSDIFKTEYINESVYMHGHHVSIEETFHIGILDLMKNENVSFVPPRANLIPVQYTDSNELLKPTVCKIFSNGRFELRIAELGLFKRSQWKDQQEWRYRLQSMPLNVNELTMTNTPNGLAIILERIRNREELEYIDLPLRDDAFDDLEILCGPKMSNESKGELTKMLVEYAPNAIINHSAMKIRPSVIPSEI
ncbi:MULTISPECIES: DUF2971 domain-containing protein [Bacillus cereus group]|uniref:DUF2971 domain-containing protein n=1 Tax=Bacillus cereus group TaxID=86661 RepID=UPI001CBD5573|nr:MULTISPECIES: DUF2971 domain-containing protein [Bacillus cereus group]MDR4971607.1 DUF2971 domain-containing protein [Bacillus toyonensis]